ncbi:MAG: hypothetical protein ACE5EX_08300, partial [Phycisphaerae bacterium]
MTFDLSDPSAKLQIGTWRFNLFDDVSLVAVIERSEVRSPGDYTWFGHLAHEERSSFILVVKRGVMAANIRVPGKGVYQVGFLGDGVHVVREVDATGPPSCGTSSLPSPHTNAFRAQTANPASCVDDGSRIDVLVVYTSAARIGAGGTAAINAKIQSVIDLSTQTYLDSQVKPRLNLVHTAETVYDEVNRSIDAMFLLLDPTDGVMDEV